MRYCITTYSLLVNILKYVWYIDYIVSWNTVCAPIDAQYNGLTCATYCRLSNDPSLCLRSDIHVSWQEQSLTGGVPTEPKGRSVITKIHKHKHIQTYECLCLQHYGHSWILVQTYIKAKMEVYFKLVFGVRPNQKCGSRAKIHRPALWAPDAHANLARKVNLKYAKHAHLVFYTLTYHSILECRLSFTCFCMSLHAFLSMKLILRAYIHCNFWIYVQFHVCGNAWHLIQATNPTKEAAPLRASLSQSAGCRRKLVLPVGWATLIAQTHSKTDFFLNCRIIQFQFTWI